MAQGFACRRSPTGALIRRLILAGAVSFASSLGEANATPDTAHLCEAAARTASAATGVPVSVLQAISLTETGRKLDRDFRPWPWTVNMEGKGVWFDDPDTAKSYVFKHFRRGARSFDIGCFQINYKWHGSAFSSIEQMFIPEENALYAARFLQDLYKETGSWSKAAGAYHSRTKKYADKYRARFDKYRTKLAKADTLPTPQPQSPASPGAQVIALRVNTYPLLQDASGQRARGSLVPLNTQQGAGLLSLFQKGG